MTNDILPPSGDKSIPVRREKKAKEAFTLSPEEMEELKKEAGEEVAREMKVKLKEEFKSQEKKKIKKATLAQEAKNEDGDDVVSVTIDLAPHAPNIRLDAQLFFHGATYQVSRAQADTLYEIMERTHMHEREIGNANMNALSGTRQKYFNGTGKSLAHAG